MRAPLVRPAAKRRGGRAADEDVVDAGPRLGEPPLLAGQVTQRARPGSRDVEVARQHDDVLRLGLRDGEPGGAQQLGLGEPLVGGVARAVQVRDDERAAVAVCDAHRLHDSPLLRPGEPGARAEAEHAGLLRRENGAG